MGRNKRERAARQEEAEARKRKLGIVAGGLAALVVGAAGSVIVSRSARTTERPPRSTAQVSSEQEWHDSIVDGGVNTMDIYSHSPTYRRLLEGSRKNPMDFFEDLEALHESGDIDDYGTRLMGSMISNFGETGAKVSRTHIRIFSHQNGIEDVLGYVSSKVKNMEEKEAVKRLLGASLFLVRSTYRAGRGIDLDVLEDDFDKRVDAGESDCETSAGFAFLNYGKLAFDSGMKSLLPDVRLLHGLFLKPEGGAYGHAWIEARIGSRWRVIECHSSEYCALLGQKFDPNRDYLTDAIMSPGEGKSYVKLNGLVYSHKINKFNPVVFSLPVNLEKEMRSNGWKPKSAPDVSTDL